MAKCVFVGRTRITIEDLLDKEIVHAICLDGMMACPPENCGGIQGYYGMVQNV